MDGKLKMAKMYKKLKLTDKTALEAVREMAVQANKDHDSKKTDMEINFFATMIGLVFIF